MKIWVVTWKYGDLSAIGIVGLYSTEKRARERLAMLVDHGDLTKVFEIHVLEVLLPSLEEVSNDELETAMKEATAQQ